MRPISVASGRVPTVAPHGLIAPQGLLGRGSLGDGPRGKAQKRRPQRVSVVAAYKSMVTLKPYSFTLVRRLMLGFRFRIPREYPTSQSSPDSSKHGVAASGSSSGEDGLGLRVSDSSSSYYYGPDGVLFFLNCLFRKLLSFIAVCVLGEGFASF